MEETVNVPKPAEPKPILITNGNSLWAIYPGDNLYAYVAALPTRDDGVTEVTSQVWSAGYSWWYTRAYEEAKGYYKALAIPLDEINLTAQEIQIGNLQTYSEKLAMSSSYLTKVLQHLIDTDVELDAAKTTLEFIVQRWLSQHPAKGSVGVQAAGVISTNRQLRDTKIRIIQLEARKRLLDGYRVILDIHWRTISRALSARIREPID